MIHAYCHPNFARWMEKIRDREAKLRIQIKGIIVMACVHVSWLLMALVDFYGIASIAYQFGDFI